MSQAEELLNSLTDDISVHTHPVTDSDTYFIIDPITHKIENTARKKRILMQRDHRSERFTFELPRYVEGHDMTLCDRVRVHYNNIGTATGAEEEEIEERADVVELTDLRINPDNAETVICSWLIERQSTQLVGILSFLVQYLCTDNGEVVYEWHSDIFEDIEIHKGRNNGEAAVIEYSNILEQWYTRIFGAGDSVMASIASESADQLAAIQAESEKQQTAIESKGAATLATIPEDYTETYNMANDATRMKAGAIVLTSEGETIVAHDSSDDYIRGLNLYGKSTQFTTTGKNLLDIKENLEWTGVYSKAVYIPAGSYVMSYSGSSWTGESAPYVRFTANDKWVPVNADAGTAVLVLNKDEDHLYVYSNGSSATNSEGVSASISQLMVSVDGGEYEPYTGAMASPNPEYPQEIASVGLDGNVIMNVYGSNLLDYETWKLSDATYATATFVDNGVILTTAEDRGDGFTNYTNKFSKVPCVPGVKYILSWEHSGSNGMVYIFPNGNVDGMISVWTNEASQLEYTPSDGVEYFTFRVGVSAPGTTATYKNVRINISEKQSFESYNDPQTVTIPRALPGISVESGGNYTDADGQQWICDEVDFERGVYVQRIGCYEVTGTEAWCMSEYQPGGVTTRYDANVTNVQGGSNIVDVLCSHYPYNGLSGGAKREGAWIASNPKETQINLRIIWYYDSLDDLVEFLSAQYAAGTPVTYLYALSNPIETALTAEELETFKALHTNYINTTILNDQGAYMKLSYNADTKTYVDNKIAEAVAKYLAAS